MEGVGEAGEGEGLQALRFMEERRPPSLKMSDEASLLLTSSFAFALYIYKYIYIFCERTCREDCMRTLSMEYIISRYAQVR